MRASLALIVLLTAACGGRQRVAPREPDEATVEKVTVEGNRVVGSDTLLEGLALTEARAHGEPLEPYLISVDTERLRGFYVRHGFFAVDVRSRLRQRDGRAAVTFVVNEGARATLERVEIVGLPDDVALDEVRATLKLRDGATFDYEAYELARPKVLEALDRKGYARAEMKASVIADRIRNEAIVRFELEPGPKCRFGVIDIQGVEGRLADAARARLELEPGETFSSARIAEAQSALYDMGRFSSVRLEAERDGAATDIPVTVLLTEADAHELRLGGGFGIDPARDEIHARASYTVAGWPTALTTTEAELRPAYTVLRDDGRMEPRLEARAAMERLDLFATRVRGVVETSFAYRSVEAYTSVGPRMRLGARAPSIVEKVNLDAGWELAYLWFRNLDPALDAMAIDRLGLDDGYLLGFFAQRASLELRDNPVEPTRGAYAELSLEEGGPFAAGELTYLRASPELRGYLPVGGLVLAARGRLGLITGDVPVTERFYAGGASSQRGFPGRRLAPTETAIVDGVERSVVVGGGASLEVGAEVRAELGTVRDVPVGGVVFLDGADVTETAGELDPTNLHWATGVGIRIGTPIGPVRLDVGYRLNRTGVGEPMPGDHFAYHLNLGEAF